MADVPTINAANNSGNENTALAVNIAAALTDLDGSEAITGYQISGLPAGFSFNKGTDATGGVWNFTPAQIAGLRLIPAAGYVGSFSLTVKVFNAETALAGVEVDTTDNTNQATRTLTITLTPDDVPVITQPETITVDETNLAGGVITVNDSISANFGTDTPGSFSANGGFFAGVPLFSNGAAVNVTRAGNLYTGATATGTVFTLQVNTNGTYQFRLVDTLDHPNANDHNDNIVLQFGVTATDSEGDPANGVITVNVLDDGPTAFADFNVVSSDAGSSVGGNVMTNDTKSQDAPNKIISIAHGGNVVDVPATGEVSIAGDHGTLTIRADGSYTYTVDPCGDDGGVGAVPYAFPETRAFPALTEGVAISGDTLNSRGIHPQALDVSYAATVEVTFVSDGAGYNNTLGAYTIAADGTLMAAQIVVPNGNTAGTAPHTLALPGGQDGFGFFLIANGFTVNSGYAGLDLVNGTLNFVYRNGTAQERLAKVSDHGADIALVYTAPGGAETVLQGAVYHTTDRGGSTAINVDESIRVVSGLPDPSDPSTLRIGFEDLPALGDRDYEDIVFDVQISARPGGDNCDCGPDEFTYVLQDADNDKSSSTLTITCAAPQLIVGSNVDDKTGSQTGWQEGNGNGVINGGLAADILIGDVGGASSQSKTQDYNVVMMLDVSGSMGTRADVNSRLSLLLSAVNNLLTEFNAYTTGVIKVHFVPFGTDAGATGTFTVTTAAGLNAAKAYLNTMPIGGNTNYEAPLMKANAWLQGAEPIPGALTYSYFITDGEPNRYQNNANQSVFSSAEVVMNEITGVTDAVNDVALLKSLSTEVIGVGINIGAATLANVAVIDSNGVALNITQASQLDVALAAVSPLNLISGAGADVLNGGDGNDLIYGDSVYTDALALAQGLDSLPGSGWEVFARLEAGEGNDAGWTRDDTVAYINANFNALAQESLSSQGTGRVGGNDTIAGGAGNDIIFGQEGRDVITGGAGNDIIFGGTGDDVFKYIGTGDGVDAIKDFDTGSDSLDLSALLAAFDPLQDSIDDFVFASESAGNTVIAVDAAGSGNAASATVLAVLQGVTGVALEDLLNANSGGNVA